VTVQILGKLEKKWRDEQFDARPLRGKRLHVRAIMRDGRDAFSVAKGFDNSNSTAAGRLGYSLAMNPSCGALCATFETDWGNGTPAPAMSTAIPAGTAGHRP
jgi:hypothetical protein